MAVEQQFLPLPDCGVRNSFTGVVVEHATGNSRAAASTAASGASETTRDPLMATDQRRECVGCRGGNSLTTVGHGGVQNVEVDPDAGIWVAQHEAHWMVEVPCDGTFDPPAFGPSSELVVDRHEEPLACGKTRRSLGCVIAKVVAAQSVTARKDARDAAKRERDRLLAEDEAKTCPAPCGDPVTRSRSGSRLAMARQIRQARQQHTKYWVAYYIAWWSVTHKCVAVPKKAGKVKAREPDDELEYFDAGEIESPAG